MKIRCPKCLTTDIENFYFSKMTHVKTICEKQEHEEGLFAVLTHSGNPISYEYGSVREDLYLSCKCGYEKQILYGVDYIEDGEFISSEQITNVGFIVK